MTHVVSKEEEAIAAEAPAKNRLSATMGDAALAALSRPLVEVPVGDASTVRRWEASEEQVASCCRQAQDHDLQTECRTVGSGPIEERSSNFQSVRATSAIERHTTKCDGHAQRFSEADVVLHCPVNSVGDALSSAQRLLETGKADSSLAEEALRHFDGDSSDLTVSSNSGCTKSFVECFDLDSDHEEGGVYHEDDEAAGDSAECSDSVSRQQQQQQQQQSNASTTVAAAKCRADIRLATDPTDASSEAAPPEISSTHCCDVLIQLINKMDDRVHHTLTSSEEGISVPFRTCGGADAADDRLPLSAAPDATNTAGMPDQRVYLWTKGKGADRKDDAPTTAKDCPRHQVSSTMAGIAVDGAEVVKELTAQQSDEISTGDTWQLLARWLDDFKRLEKIAGQQVLDHACDMAIRGLAHELRELRNAKSCVEYFERKISQRDSSRPTVIEGSCSRAAWPGMPAARLYPMAQPTEQFFESATIGAMWPWPPAVAVDGFIRAGGRPQTPLCNTVLLTGGPPQQPAYTLSSQGAACASALGSYPMPLPPAASGASPELATVGGMCPWPPAVPTDGYIRAGSWPQTPLCSTVPLIGGPPQQPAYTLSLPGSGRASALGSCPVPPLPAVSSVNSGSSCYIPTSRCEGDASQQRSLSNTISVPFLSRPPSSGQQVLSIDSSCYHQQQEFWWRNADGESDFKFALTLLSKKRIDVKCSNVTVTDNGIVVLATDKGLRLHGASRPRELFKFRDIQVYRCVAFVPDGVHCADGSAFSERGTVLVAGNKSAKSLELLVLSGSGQTSRCDVADILMNDNIPWCVAVDRQGRIVAVSSGRFLHTLPVPLDRRCERCKFEIGYTVSALAYDCQALIVGSSEKQDGRYALEARDSSNVDRRLWMMWLDEAVSGLNCDRHSHCYVLLARSRAFRIVSVERGTQLAEITLDSRLPPVAMYANDQWLALILNDGTLAQFAMLHDVQGRAR